MGSCLSAPHELSSSFYVKKYQTVSFMGKCAHILVLQMNRNPAKTGDATDRQGGAGVFRLTWDSC